MRKTKLTVLSVLISLGALAQPGALDNEFAAGQVFADVDFLQGLEITTESVVDDQDRIWLSGITLAGEDYQIILSRLSPDGVYEPLLGDASELKGASIQTGYNGVYNVTANWVNQSREAGKPWVVANDEQRSANEDEVYQIDPSDGTTILFASEIPVQGGDLVATETGEIFLIRRRNSGGSDLYNITPGFALPVATVANSINGAALLTGGGFIMAEGSGSSTFHLYDPLGVSQGTLNAVDEFGAVFNLFDGDMASACLDPNTDIPPPGQCFATEIIDFNQGLQTDGAPVALDRSNPNNALGAPDESNAPGGFVSLGVGGSITIGFDGIISDGPGDDILIFETTFSGDACGTGDDEFAFVELSEDGLVFEPAGYLCRDGGVDITPTGLSNVTQVRITNDGATTTLDGYDVDGVIAVYNCEEDSEPETLTPNTAISNTLKSFPNPSSGDLNVIFSSTATGRLTLDLYDLRGLKLAGIFSGIIEDGSSRQVSYDASHLTNGIYILRLSTEHGVKNEKIIISK